jgi:hypothetical protein
MSGFAEGSDFSASALTSSTTFLEKPFTFSTLTERMRELIDEPAAEPPPLQSATFRR